MVALAAQAPEVAPAGAPDQAAQRAQALRGGAALRVAQVRRSTSGATSNCGSGTRRPQRLDDNNAPAAPSQSWVSASRSSANPARGYTGHEPDHAEPLALNSATPPNTTGTRPRTRPDFLRV